MATDLAEIPAVPEILQTGIHYAMNAPPRKSACDVIFMPPHGRRGPSRLIMGVGVPLNFDRMRREKTMLNKEHI